jgi:hypothetical protein
VDSLKALDPERPIREVTKCTAAKPSIYLLASLAAKDLLRASFAQGLLNPLTRKAISSVPELAKRTPFALVVDPFLVGAADYRVSHRN